MICRFLYSPEVKVCLLESQHLKDLGDCIDLANVNIVSEPGQKCNSSRSKAAKGQETECEKWDVSSI